MQKNITFTFRIITKYQSFIGDSFDNNNKIYDEYNDYCRVREGIDHSWSIGTDTRQISLLDPGWQSPNAMCEMLNDDIKRRFYILDADIEVSFKISSITSLE